MVRRILIAYDESPGAEKALQAAISMAKEYDAELHLIAVEEGLPRYASREPWLSDRAAPRSAAQKHHETRRSKSRLPGGVDHSRRAGVSSRPVEISGRICRV